MLATARPPRLPPRLVCLIQPSALSLSICALAVRSLRPVISLSLPAERKKPFPSPLSNVDISSPTKPVLPVTLASMKADCQTNLEFRVLLLGVKPLPSSPLGR